MAAHPLPSSAFLLPGTPLGRYQLERPLAIGGMAEVYLARAVGPQGFAKRVVLKRILPRYAANPEFVTRFFNEARLAALLDHPNIVQVHDVEAYEGSYFITMEYVVGQNLNAVFERALALRQKPSLSSLVGIGLGLATGLAYAHDAHGQNGEPLRLVHRAVSPSNVLLAYNGTVKVTDFGIAQARTSAGGDTTSGTLKGKVSYMSPEQCLGEPLDRRSDIFSIGVVLYELATGRRLFARPDALASMNAIVGENITPPSQLRRDLPPAFERILLQALAPRRDDRQPGALDLARELAQLARDQRLDVSPLALSEYMGELFAPEIAADTADHRAQAPNLPLAPGSDDPSIEIIAAPGEFLALGGAAALGGAERAAARRDWIVLTMLALATVAVASGLWLAARRGQAPAAGREPGIESASPTAPTHPARPRIR